MCVNAGPPLMSPSAKIPRGIGFEFFVRANKAAIVVTTPAAARLSESELGARPVATSRCVPSRVRSLPETRTLSEMAERERETLSAVAFSKM